MAKHRAPRLGRRDARRVVDLLSAGDPVPRRTEAPQAPAGDGSRGVTRTLEVIGAAVDRDPGNVALARQYAHAVTAVTKLEAARAKREEIKQTTRPAHRFAKMPEDELDAQWREWAGGILDGFLADEAYWPLFRERELRIADVLEALAAQGDAPHGA